jgi:hypothetical protein
MARRAGLACVLLLVFLVACSTSDSSDVSSADTDAYNEGIDEINRAWEEFRVTANACNVADGPCFDEALDSSGVEQAVSDLQATVRSLARAVETGECRSSLTAFDAGLEDLLDSLEALKDDAQAADASGIESSAPAVRSAWDAAVEDQGSTVVCFSGGFAPTTDR